MVDINDAMGDMGTSMEDKRARYNELKAKEQNMELDDKGREELNTLRSHFETE
jgi:hypothetical protein